MTKAIIEVRRWNGDGSDNAILDSMGRKSPNHMPEGVWLKQNHSGRYAGDRSRDVTFTLVIEKGGEVQWASPGDFVCTMSDGSFETRSQDSILLLNGSDAKRFRFYSRDPRDAAWQAVTEVTDEDDET